LELFIYLQEAVEPVDVKRLIVVTTVIFLMALVFIVSYIFIYNNRKKKHIEEKHTLETNFRQEVLKTQVEVQEQTLTNISREIHDNITQVLSFVKLNLSMAGDGKDEKQQKIDESRELIAQVINDLRTLSKSMSFEHIAAAGLVKTLEAETKRINKSGITDIQLLVAGEEYSLGEQRELVLFRIVQEGLNNAFKHANAKHLEISLQYSDELFTLTLEDDGKGFSVDALKGNEGSGLKNISSRATLIGAVANIKSAPNEGCCITVSLNPIHTNGNSQNSIS